MSREDTTAADARFNAAHAAFPTALSTGLTKREYFAAAALKGLCANPEYTALEERDLADEAVTIAAALLQALAAETDEEDDAGADAVG